jgi:signal transduction histidine kinase
MSDTFETSKDVVWLKDLYFSNPKDQIVLTQGETLLSEGTYNDKLFLILDGTLSGFLEDENGELFEVYKSRRNMFVGVYSFFSPDHISYLTLVADETTTVAYITQEVKAKAEEQFAAKFLPVIVHEVYLRQLLTQQLSRQRQAAIKKLYENEKMATLGQLAAGLAHELNNAIGVMQRNTEWLIDSLSEYLRNRKLNNVFETSLQEGLPFSTSALREKRKSLEKRFDLSAKFAKQLAKTNLTEDEIAEMLKQNTSALDTINLISEAGFVLHDMRVAANHSTHVVHSVRELGFSNGGNAVQISVHETINKSLALVKSILQNINVEVKKNSEGMIYANPGDLVQIWVNLIKNACESMTSTPTPNARIIISVSEQGQNILVSIADNGPGIPKELMAKVFEPNFTTKVRGLSFGLGLGLSIVKKIISNYRGTISVTSKQGDTVFTVSLPAKPIVATT